MNKFNKSQILILSLLLLLLTITPLLSSSLRPKYLYFIFNLFIIALGVESGLLSALISKPNYNNSDQDHQKPSFSSSSSSSSSSSKPIQAASDNNNNKVVEAASGEKNVAYKPKVVEKSKSEKIVKLTNVQAVKKYPSTPSIFFIGSGGTSNDHHDDHDLAPEAEEDQTGEDDDYEEIDKHEHHHHRGDEDQLFAKAETFIGNFYKQLNMQREESWKRIHGLYKKAF